MACPMRSSLPRPMPPRRKMAADFLLTERAPAKINLTLHITGRRADGFHTLESLVAFSRAGDTVSLAPGKALTLSVGGPSAAASGRIEDNLISRAARHFA